MVINVRWIKFGSVLVLSVTSCADLSREVNENTLALSTTVSQIHNQQIIENLQRFIEDAYELPAQVTLSGGGVQVTNSISPTFGNFIRPWKAFSASLSNSYTQNWAVTPINDPDDVRRLRALYRLAVYGYKGDRANKGNPEDDGYNSLSQDADFDLEYPRITLFANSTESTTEDQNTYTDIRSSSPATPPHKGSITRRTSENHTLTTTLGRVDSRLLDSRFCVASSPDTACPTHPYFTPRVVHAVDSIDPVDQHVIATHLTVPHRWLYWSSGPLGLGPVDHPYPPPLHSTCVRIWPLYISTTRFKHTLFSCSTLLKERGAEMDAWRQFDEFSMWVWGATPNSLGNGSSGGSAAAGIGGGGGKSKGSPAPVIQNPAGAGHS